MNWMEITASRDSLHSKCDLHCKAAWKNGGFSL